MPKYIVNLPLVGEVSVEVEAESKKDAIEKALDNFTFIGDIEVKDGYLESLDPMRKLVEGNFFHGPISEAYAEEIEEDDEECEQH